MIDKHAFIERITPEPHHGRAAFDELVAKSVDIHIERMADGSYWMSISEHNGPPKLRQIVRFQIAHPSVTIVATTEKE